MPRSAIDRLLDLPRFAGRSGPGYNPGLERMESLLYAMGNPHRAIPVVHVAGTNGKGSTASMIAAIGTASGRRIGLHTSPHLMRITERMRIDGVPAPEAWLAGAVDRFRDVLKETGPSFFEATTALSFLYFAEMATDAAVIEVGLGGRLDATNVVDPAVCVITSIGLEHTEILGADHKMIAREKAGIIKAGIPVVSGVRKAHGRDVIRKVARECDALFIEPSAEETRRMEPGIRGMHQKQNAALAVAASRVIWADLKSESVERGLKEVVALSGLRGRLEEVAPGLIVDVAHNADGIATALSEVRKAGVPVHVILALMSDKDCDAVAAVIAEGAASVDVLDLRGDRLMPAAELRDKLLVHDVDVREIVRISGLKASVSDALDAGAITLATGSHLVVAEILKAFEMDD